MHQILLCQGHGAITITEIANIGKPSILVPLPNVSNNHQQYNAEVLESVGAARIIINEELNPIVLDENILEMLNKDTLEEMGNLAKSVSIQNVEDRIYEEIKKLVRKE